MNALEEGLVKDVTVQIEDCADLTIYQELDLREVLTPRTGAQIDSLFNDLGFLVERQWHPLGRKLVVVKEGQQRQACFRGPTLSVRAVMSPGDSARVHEGEIGNAKQIATELNEELVKLLPDEVHGWAVSPAWDAFNRQWSFRFNVVLKEGTDGLEGDYKEIYTTAVPPVPPDFAMPDGLSPDGQRAWEIIVRQLAAYDDLKSGGHTHVFYSPQAWKAKREDYGDGSELIVVHDGGNHAPYFNRDYEARILADKMELELRKAWLYPQPMTSWGTAIYKLEHTDTETEAAFADEIARQEQRKNPEMDRLIQHAKRAVQGHVPGEVQEGLDDEGLKDLGVPSYVDVVTALLKQAGLEVSPELFHWKRGNEVWVESFVPTTAQFPWALDADQWEPPKDLMLALAPKLSEAIGMPVSPNMSYQPQEGRWRISWAIKLGKGEFDESSETSELAHPESKYERIKLLFHNAGLHIYSAIEEPRDEGWGDLGQPKRVVQSYLQPTGDKPFSRDALGTQGLADFCRQVASQLGEILETMDVDWVTRYDTELGAWRITWYIGDAAITSHRVIEAYGDPNDELPLEPDDVSWKELVTGHITHIDVEALMAEHGIISVLDRMSHGQHASPPDIVPEGWRIFIGKWKPHIQWDDGADKLGMALRQGMQQLGVKKDAIHFYYDFATGEVELSLPQKALDESESVVREGLEDEGVAKEVQSPEQTMAIQAILTAKGLTDINVWDHGSLFLWADGISQKVLTRPELGDIEYELKEQLNALGASTESEPVGAGAKYRFIIWRRRENPQPTYEALPMLVSAGATVRKCQEHDGRLLITGEWPDGHFTLQLPLRESEYKELYGPMLPIDSIESIIREGGVTKLVRQSERSTTLDWKQTRQVPATVITWEGTLDPAIADKAGYPTHTPDGRKIEVADLVHAQHIGWKIKELPGVISVHVDTLPVTDYANRTRTARFFVVFEEPTKAAAERIAYQRRMQEDSAEGDDNRVAIVAVFRLASTGPHCASDTSSGAEKPSARRYEVLVCKREVDPEAGKWCIPGGHAKEGEAIVDGAKREMAEETHLELGDLTFIKKMPNETREAVVYTYGTMMPDGDKAIAGDDAEKLKWVPIDDLPELAFDNNELVGEIASKMKLSEPHYGDDGSQDYIDDPGGKKQAALAEAKESKNGFLIVFEGIDGAGKTTQVRRLSDWLNDHGYSFVTTKWNSSKLLSDVLWKAKKKKDLTPMLFSLLHASDMHLRYEKQVLPALAEGKVVLCDRYYYTSYVRDQIRDIDPELLDHVYEDFREPDLVFHCVVPVKVAVERLMDERGVGYYSSGQDVGYGVKGKEASTEKYEQDMADRYKKVFKGKSQVVDLDMDRPISAIAKDIKKEVRKLLKMEALAETLVKAEELRHQLNEDQESVVFTKITDEMLPSLEEAMKAAFPQQAGWVFGYCMQHGDPDLSVVAVDGDQRVIGFYILGERDVLRGTAGMDKTEDLSPYEGKRGVEGIALGVVPEVRGKGIGNRFKDYPKHLGFDYIWGLQLADLNNLQHWLKRRRLVAKSSGDRMFATLQDFK